MEGGRVRGVLIVEDDGDLARIMMRALEAEGMSACTASSAEDAYDLLADAAFDCLVVDINLPGDDGIELCRNLRRVSSAPVLFASARLGADVRVAALDGGGDAYLPKPFSLREMTAQVRALMRRSAGAPSGTAEQVVFGPFTLDEAAGRILKEGAAVRLSPKEFDLAAHLMRHEGHAFTKEELLAEVWGAFSAVEPQTVAVHMSWIRAKLEDDPTAPLFFKTVRGRGYLFNAGGEGAS